MDPISELMATVFAKLEELASAQNVNMRAVRAGFGALGQLAVLGAAVDERLAVWDGTGDPLAPLASSAADTERIVGAFLAGDYSDAEACPPARARPSTTPGLVKRLENRAKGAESRAKRAEDALGRSKADADYLRAQVRAKGPQPKAAPPPPPRGLSAVEKASVFFLPPLAAVYAAERERGGR